jgi:glycine/D-amino acid oxidase-like deaminating enzyme/nitrite reductase/ring-hydroxylating ferredoxin subunit
MNANDEHTKSLSMSVAVAPDAPVLSMDVQCDSVVIGSGIAGLSCAYELAVEGQFVVVLDRGAIGGGITSRTTAHLTPICDDTISSMLKLRGETASRLFYESHCAAIDRIEAICEQHAISCNFRRLDGLLFPAMGSDAKEIRQTLQTEYEAGRKIGVQLERARGVPFATLNDAPCLRYPQQATFHPLKYLRGLISAIGERGGKLFANSPVIKVEEGGAGVSVTTETGLHVNAGRVIVATNSPINDKVAIHSKLAPYRTYAIVFTLPRGSIDDALYWDTADPYHYVRLNPGPGSVDYLIVGGADHKSGEVDDGDVRFEAVEAWTRSLLPDLGKEVHRWSGQVLDTVDYSAFIGKNPGNDNVFIVTGDSGQGITHGALSGLLLKDLILNGSSPWASVYDPTRKLGGADVNFASENIAAVKNYAESLAPGELRSVEELEPGKGAIIGIGSKKIAAYRKPNGTLHQRSAVCTHLGCQVQWNSTETCWDCSCHGSHFSIDGDVLNGPAIAGLAPIESMPIRE